MTFSILHLESLSTYIISNHRSQFINIFTRKLYHILKIEVVSSTVSYFQLNRQIDQINQELNQYF